MPKMEVMCNHSANSLLSIMAHVWRWVALSGARASAGGRGLCDLKMFPSNQTISALVESQFSPLLLFL